MAHERDEKYDSHDDSEYHFSDDQVSYETESSDVKSSASGRDAVIAKLSQHRRPLIGLALFFVLIFSVYKIITPTNTTPSTEISQVASSSMDNTPITAGNNAIESTKTLKLATDQPVATPEAAPAAAVQQQANPVETAQAPQAMQQQTLPAPPVPVPVQQSMAQQQMMPQEAVAMPPPPGMQMPASQAPMSNTMSEPDRIVVLETQNSKLQADFTQKIAEQEAQNAALQNKIQDLTMRMTSLEATLIRLGRMMHEMKGGRMTEEGAPAPVRMMAAPAAAGPRVTYSVQAIIPGRAWLKSESGETLTVTEGDAVKGLGRVAKIDPYDGIVQIDSSGHMISLSYGATAES